METMNSVSSFTLADAVERNIYEYICKNKMNEGDMLPREEELAKKLNVSRNVVREALSRLRMLGLVETRKKRGMTLAQPDAFIGLERMVTTGIMSREYRNDLMEMRIILELGMSDYIFHHHTAEDIEELESIIANEANVSGTALEDIEIYFHSKLYEMSGNQVLKRLQGILRPFFKNIESSPGRSNNSMPPPSHHDICQALKNGYAEDFRQIMYRHLSVYMNF